MPLRNLSETFPYLAVCLANNVSIFLSWKYSGPCSCRPCVAACRVARLRDWDAKYSALLCCIFSSGRRNVPAKSHVDGAKEHNDLHDGNIDCVEERLLF